MYTLDTPQNEPRRPSVSTVTGAVSVPHSTSPPSALPPPASSAGPSSRLQLHSVGAPSRFHEYKASDASEDGDSAADADANARTDAHLTGDRQSRLPSLSAHKTDESSSSSGNVYFNYAILPDGVNVDGWTEEEKEQLNDHVRHMLHSRRSKFGRSMKGFAKYVSKRKFCLIRELRRRYRSFRVLDSID